MAPLMHIKPSKTVIMYSASKERSPIASSHRLTHASVSDTRMKKYGHGVANGLLSHGVAHGPYGWGPAMTHLSISTHALVVNMLPASEPPSAPT